MDQTVDIYPVTRDELHKQMQACAQTDGQNILEHGLSVCDHLFDLLNHLEGKDARYAWKIPPWLTRELYKREKHRLCDSDTLRLYTTYHDCGKPFCKDGLHFPAHALYSYHYFNQVFNNPTAAQLILHDMDVHLCKPSNVANLLQANPNAFTLLLASLAEIHSNAAMFGGTDSASFKIKWKHIDKVGRNLIAMFV